VKVQVLLSRPIIYNAGDGEMVDAPVKQKQEPVKLGLISANINKLTMIK
jgi:hypothetical protein